MSYAIVCRDLFKRYDSRPPVEAVCGLNLEVKVGECFGLLGPNGAGKTTSLEILEGLLEATTGEVEILGLRWKQDAAEIRQRIGISLQETKLSDKLTVRETVALFRSFYRKGIPPEEAIRLVSLEEKSRTYNVNLSGGQRQRLTVACALVGDPELLFLDEPTTGLDPQSRRQLWDVINTFRSSNRTVMLTTHYMDEAERLCNRVAIVDHGKVIALGTPSELISRVGGEHVISFALAPNEKPPLDANELTSLPSVQSSWTEQENFCLSVGEPHLALPALLNFLQTSGRVLSILSTRHATLEDVFVKFTGRHLREGDAPG